MNRLKELRKLNKKTQQNLADFLNISQQAYATYENDTRMPPIDILQRIADYFSVSIDYLLDRDEKTIKNEPIDKTIDPRLATALKKLDFPIENLSKLNDNQIKLIADLINQLKNK